MGDGKVKGLLGGRGASWIGMSVQNILLGDGSEREFDRLNLDLMSLTVLAFPHGDSKCEELVREDVRHFNFAGGILIEPAMRLPRFLVAMPLGSVHSCSAHRFPRSVSKTLYLSQLGTVASVHCLWEVRPGRHKVAGNKIHIMTGCCRRRQGLNCSGCNTWGGVHRTWGEVLVVVHFPRPQSCAWMWVPWVLG